MLPFQTECSEMKLEHGESTSASTNEENGDRLLSFLDVQIISMKKKMLLEIQICFTNGIWNGRRDAPQSSPGCHCTFISTLHFTFFFDFTIDFSWIYSQTIIFWISDLWSLAGSLNAPFAPKLQRMLTSKWALDDYWHPIAFLFPTTIVLRIPTKKINLKIRIDLWIVFERGV